MRSFTGRLKIVVVLGALVIVKAGPAHAADPAWPPAYEPAAVQEFATGWYLRGDIGYRFENIGGASSLLSASPTGNTLGDAWMIGGGFGVKYGWFRVDLTADYSTNANYKGTLVLPGDVHANIEGVTALANVYVDLGTWSGFTPYVGVGIGASYLWTEGLESPAIPVNTIVPSAVAWNFAWALMAGASYQISDRLLVDAGYRYLNLGNARSGDDALGNFVSFNDITAHEIRVGLRYLVD